ncbi:hypothetical protein Esti_006614 [Eimeria stiedai]
MESLKSWSIRLCSSESSSSSSSIDEAPWGPPPVAMRLKGGDDPGTSLPCWWLRARPAVIAGGQPRGAAAAAGAGALGNLSIAASRRRAGAAAAARTTAAAAAAAPAASAVCRSQLVRRCCLTWGSQQVGLLALRSYCYATSLRQQQQQQQRQQQQQQRCFSKIVRWRADTTLAYGLEAFAEAEDFFKACAQSQDRMTRRDWLAALSLVSTRRRLDLRSRAFRAFVAAALQQQPLLQAPQIHLTIHRFAAIGYGPALWQLGLLLQPLLQQQQLSSRQLAVSAWGLAKGGVTHPPLWDLIGSESLRLAQSLSVSDLSMVLWAFARIERVKPAELITLKEHVMSRLEGFVQHTLSSAAACPTAAATAAAAHPAGAARDLNALPVGQKGSTALSHSPLTSRREADPVHAEPSAVAAAEAAEGDDAEKNPPPPPAAAAAAAFAVSPHDLCMLLRSFASLTPRDAPLILRLLYTLLLACRVQPAAVSPATAEGAETPGGLEPLVDFTGRGLGPLTAQGLTAVWTALRDAQFTKVFGLPQHKRTLSSSSSNSRHQAYLPFRETVPLECLPLLLPILKHALAYPQGFPAAAAAAVAAPPAVGATAEPLVAAPRASAAEATAAAPHKTAAAGTAAAALKYPAAAAATASEEVGLRSPALLHTACCSVLLEVLCEETRQLRLDHTTNTNMVGLLATALADMQLIDPRVVYQLVLFTQRKGAAQFQGEQLIKVLNAFEQCSIADTKAWNRLAHRAQDVAADIDLVSLRRLRRLLRRGGHANARVEGVLQHFESLKEDISRCGPL